MYIYIYRTGTSVGRQNQARFFFFYLNQDRALAIFMLDWQITHQTARCRTHACVAHTHTQTHTACHIHSLCVDKHTMCSKKNKKIEHEKICVGYACMGLFCVFLSMSTNNIYLHTYIIYIYI